MNGLFFEEENKGIIINEGELLKLFDNSNSVLLVEPFYKRKYPPLALMKISKYFKDNAKKVMYTRKAIKTDCDIICVTTLFTYDYNIVVNTLKWLRFSNPDKKIIIGGILASINPKKIAALIGNSYVFSGYSKVLDSIGLDYDYDYKVNPKFNTFSYVFTTRGCSNNCSYCFVPKIEPNHVIIPNWEKNVNLERKNIFIHDNNITSFSLEHISNVADFCNKNNLKVILDNGIDCKLIDNKMAETLSKFKFIDHGLRTAFDRIEEDQIFQNAVKILLTTGISKNKIMAYVLFNFNDTPKEADYRARECVKLGIRPYPQCFKPFNAYSRKIKHIGKHWTFGLVRAFNEFWLLAGVYSTTDFISYCTKNKKKFNLKDEDFAKLL